MDLAIPVEKYRGGIVQADLHTPSHGEEIMKRMGVLLAVALMAATILSGCVVVPAGGWYGGGGYYRPYPYHHPYYYSYPYRRGW